MRAGCRSGVDEVAESALWRVAVVGRCGAGRWRGGGATGLTLLLVELATLAARSESPRRRRVAERIRRSEVGGWGSLLDDSPSESVDRGYWLGVTERRLA